MNPASPPLPPLPSADHPPLPSGGTSLGPVALAAASGQTAEAIRARWNRAADLSDQPPLRYQPILSEEGLYLHYDTNEVVDQVVRGRVVYIGDQQYYHHLYKAFQRRFGRSNQKRLAQKRIGESLWVIKAVPADQAELEIDLLPGFEPHYGRYKIYAQQLLEQNLWQSPSEAEARKVMAAFRHHIPKAKRAHLRLVRRRTGESWTVFAVPRT